VREEKEDKRGRERRLSEEGGGCYVREEKEEKRGRERRSEKIHYISSD